MAIPEQLALLKQDVEAWNKWRLANPGIKPDLIRADFRGANLEGADLREANLESADLREANLERADLSKAELYRTNLKKANLRKAKLFGANLITADLCWATLCEADLYEADLREADLYGADLTSARSSGADFRGANLEGADFTMAILQEADLSGTALSGADLLGTVLGGTILAFTNLAEVKHLNTCRHWGLSILDFHTLQQSGLLPLDFLRGCGLPDLLIDYLPSLLNQPIQYYSCFISYSSKDEDFAQRLHADLQNKGVRCWFAPDDMKAGQEIYEQIGEAIRLHEKLLLVLSEHSMSSKWVEAELIKARQRAVREKRQVLFPIRLVAFEAIQHWERFDADTGTDLAREVRKYFIPDFSNWKNHDDYQQAFDRLLRDLKLELERKPTTS